VHKRENNPHEAEEDVLEGLIAKRNKAVKDARVFLSMFSTHFPSEIAAKSSENAVGAVAVATGLAKSLDRRIKLFDRFSYNRLNLEKKFEQMTSNKEKLEDKVNKEKQNLEDLETKERWRSGSSSPKVKREQKILSQKAKVEMAQVELKSWLR